MPRCCHCRRAPFFAATIFCALLAVCVVGVAQQPAKPKDFPEGKTDPNADYSGELPRIPPLEPDKALATLQILPPFQVQLVAAEPLVADPTAASFDERGRLYVVCMRGYSEDGAEKLSEVRLLEDSDGDGQFDRSTVFLDKLVEPTAIICYDGGVFVADAPDILFAKDTNGDGKADEQKVVITGFSTANIQGLVNSFRWGLDNRIHGAGSSSGGKIFPIGRESEAVVINGRDFAFDPKTLAIEATSGGCQHGMSFDEWGRKFVCSNSSHLELVMFEDRYARRNPLLATPAARLAIAADGGQAEVFRISPIEPWRLVRTRLRVAGAVPGPVEGGGRAAGYFTSATGVTIYRGNAWPREFYGQAIVGDVGSNLVHRKVLKQNGVALRGERIDEKREFLASKDIWFRPVQFAEAPDGTLFVLDMYREVIEHPLSLPPPIKKHLDLTSGRDLGRIYRIAPKGFKQPAPPRLHEADGQALVSLLEHPNAWHRETAARLIYQQQDQSLAAALERMVAKSESPLGRMHALYALDGLGKLSAETIERALEDKHPRVREHGVRLAEKSANNSETVRSALFALTDDEDIRVRYQLAFTLGEIESPGRNGALAAIAKRDGGDSWVRLAVLTSLGQGAGEVYSLLAADAAFRKTPAGREMLSALAQQIGAANRKDELAAVVQSLDRLRQSDAELSQVVLRQLSQGLGKSGSPLRAALDSVASNAGELLNDLLSSARKTAKDESLPPAARAEAIRTLALSSYEVEKALLETLLAGRESVEVQTAALAALSRFDNAGIADIVLAAWPGLSPSVRTQATEVLFARTERIAKLLDAVERDELKPSDFDAARIKFLRTHRDEKLRARAEKLLSDVKLARRQEVVDAYMSALTLKGDLARGQVLFQKHCSQCHRVKNVGHEIAPNLAAMKNRGAEAILFNVLDPNREVNPLYFNYLVVTTEGTSATGLIASETASSVTLRRGEGQTDTILRKNIDVLQNTGMSIMPEGFEKQLDVQALADLIAFLMGE